MPTTPKPENARKESAIKGIASDGDQDFSDLNKPSKWKTVGRVFWVLFFAGVVAAGVWFYQQNIIDGVKADNAELTAQVKDAKTAQKKAEAELADAQAQLEKSESGSTPTIPPGEKSNIEAAINSKNYAALESYMADKVSYAVAASEAAGTVTKAQAVDKLSYFNSATGPWNFAIASTTLTKYKSGAYKTYLVDNTIFGVSANKYFVSFHLDANNKIDRVFMAATTDLL